MTDDMRYLGQQSPMADDPDAFILECVPNPNTAHFYGARFTLPEFTSLCPVTGQPDFATIIIDYIPDKLLVESKALKLYATAFRNIGDFHEACSNKIADKIVDAAAPHYLRLVAFWYPRGGIPIDCCIRRGKSDARAGAVVSDHSRMFEDYLIPFPRRDYRGR